MDTGALLTTACFGLLLAAGAWLANRGQFWRPVLLAVLATLFVRLPQSPVPIFNIDEAINAAIAVRLQEGAVLYGGAWDHKPPLSFYLYRLIFDLFGRWNMTAVHIVGAGLYAAVIVLTGLAGRRLLPPPARPWGALLLAPYGLLYYRFDFMATNHESAGVPFLLAGVLLLWRALDLPAWSSEGTLRWYRRRTPLLVLAGATGAIGGLFREACAMGVVVSALFVILRPWLARRSVTWREAAADLAALLAGALLVAGTFVGWLAAHGLMKDAWFLMIVHNLRYRAAGREGWGLVVHTVSTVLHFIAYAPALWISTLGGFGALAHRCIRPLLRRRPIEGEALFLLLWVLGAGFFVLQGGRLHGHYFVPFYPPMMLSTAWFLASLRGPVLKPALVPGGSDARPEPEPRWARFVARPGAGLLTLTLLLSLIPFHVIQSDSLARCVERFILGRQEVRAVFKDIMVTQAHHNVAMAIRRTTTREESVFVWGFCPQLYVLGRLRPATRFTFTAILSGKTVEGGRIESEKRAWDLLKEDLERERPAIIVDAASMFLKDIPLEQFPEFRKWLRQRYRPLGEVEGCGFYERIGRLPANRPAPAPGAAPAPAP